MLGSEPCWKFGVLYAESDQRKPAPRGKNNVLAKYTCAYTQGRVLSVLTPLVIQVARPLVAAGREPKYSEVNRGDWAK